MAKDNVKDEEETVSIGLDPKKRGLGRGLDALFGDTEDRDGSDEGVSRETPTDSASAPLRVSIADIRPSGFQPRRSFNPETIDELSQSIARHGVLQPLVVRKDPENPTGYELIAGERRWRASQKAKLHDVPVIVKEMTDLEVLEVALIENLQREDLNAIEEAMGYQRLTDEFGYSQSNLAKHLGKSRPHIVNTMRLLKLPEPVQEMVAVGDLSAGHARTLVGNKDALTLAKKMVKDGLSVRDAEALQKTGNKKKALKSSGTSKGPDTIALEKEMTDRLGMKLEIEDKGAKGKVVIHYTGFDQLDEVIHRLSKH